MIIQLNTDNNINVDERSNTYFTTVISDTLDRFSDHITRIEVHFTDENAQKKGKNDHRCMIEARLEGRQPIAVSDNADSVEQALKGALDKLKASLDTVLGRLKDH